MSWLRQDVTLPIESDACVMPRRVQLVDTNFHST